MVDSMSGAGKSLSKQVLAMYSNLDYSPPPTLILESPEAKHSKRLDLFERIKIGRTTSSKTIASSTNGYFDSKVLSRTHAEIWCESNQIFIRDVGSSNGTFVNGQRLSEENQQSAPTQFQTGDSIEFGVDIMNDSGDDVLFKKVSVIVTVCSAQDGEPIISTGARRDVTHDSRATLKLDGKSTASKLLAGRGDAQKANNAAVKEVQGLIAPLQNQLAKSKQVSKDLSAIKNNISNIQSAIQHVDVRDIEDMKQKFNEAENERDRAQEMLNTVRQQLQDKSSRLSQLQDQHRDTLRQCEQLRAQQQRSSQSNTIRGDHGIDSEQVEKMNQENNTLNRRVSVLMDTISKLEAEVETLKAEKHQLKRKASTKPNVEMRSNSHKTFNLFTFSVLIALVACAVYYYVGWPSIQSFIQENVGTYLEEITNDDTKVVSNPSQPVIYGPQREDI